MVRFATIKDLDRIVEIEKNSFDDPWSENSLRAELEDNNLSEVYVIESQGITAGYMSYMKIIDEIHINNIAIDKDYRGMGLGRELVEYVINNLKEKYSITLEVREDNIPAVNLYKSIGFEEMGKRKDYYGKGQNAIIMWIRR